MRNQSTKPVLAAAIVFFSAGFAFAEINAPASSTGTISRPAQENAAKLKNILARLIRQNEYLDETLDTLGSAGKKLSAQEIAALGFGLRRIKGNLDSVSELEAAQLTEMRPGSGLSQYTRTILSYSRSISKKIARVGALTAKAALKNGGPAVRDAVSSRPGTGRGGRKLTRLLEERRAMDHLAADAKALKFSSDKLTAAGKWLYITSK
jgi:hypothetical protein